ncbi:MAG: hypothetical protein IT258_14175 [Saprospiraceae bacterium]|nr:hypothetical protein [Saprospiraceae bacterium]
MYWLKPTPDTAPPSIQSDSKVRLQGQHLWLAAEVAQGVFGDSHQVFAVYYDNLKSLLLAPVTDETFKAAHECSMLFVKVRNQQGDRTISLQELILDHDIDDTDRDLAYAWVPGLTMMQVKL